jgi:hypothetical protein
MGNKKIPANGLRETNDVHFYNGAPQAQDAKL